MLYLALSVCLCLVLFAKSAALDVYVSNTFTAAQCTPAERNCPDIASALNISTSYSTVYLYAGIYSGTGNANLCIGKCVNLKGVTLAGLSGAGDVILASGNVQFADSVAIYIFENTITRIANITIQDYWNTLSTEPNKAGAMEVVNSKVLFENVVFQNNSGVIGGAIHVTNSSITLNHTMFFRNSARLHGGGLYLLNSNAHIENCLFHRNNVSTIPANAAGTGGAIYFIGVNDLYLGNTEFLQNSAMRSGGAVFMQLNSNTGIKSLSGQFTATNCHFKDNLVNGLGNCVYSGTCNARGGALFINALSTDLTHCVFEGNKALTASTTEAAQGGGLYASTNALDILSPYVGTSVHNCTFRQNHATGQGGAMFVTGQRLDLYDSVFVENYVDTVNSYFTDNAAQGGAVFFSSGNVGAVASNIKDCVFTQNSAYSGWGGAFFGTDSLGAMYIARTTFTKNNAYSSYTNAGHGGAVMVASNFLVSIAHCDFHNNSALPYLQLVPLTYSGSGGAIFAQTASINVTHSDFSNNFALTGQFDSGASGGAIMLEDCYPAKVTHTTFYANGAAGYYGYSSFASPGTGGAIYVKFSAAELLHNIYTDNWVSAGGNEASIGGAVAVFFEYSSVSKKVVGVVITHSQFTNNYAYGELCSAPNQAGQGGGLAVVGAAKPAVIVAHCNFTNNLAITASKRSSSYAKSDSVSLGGAMSIALSSNVSIEEVYFNNNLAYNGAGNDLSSISGQSDQENFVHATDCTFRAGGKVDQTVLLQQAIQYTVNICNTMRGYFEQAKDMIIDKSTQSVYYKQHHTTHAHLNNNNQGAPAIYSNIPALADNVVPTFFAAPALWREHLSTSYATPTSIPVSTAKPTTASTTTATTTDILTASTNHTAQSEPSHLPTQLAEASKQARWHYLQSYDTSLLSRTGARKRVNRVVNLILQLDLWREAQFEANSNIDAVQSTATVLDIHVDTLFQRSPSTHCPVKGAFVGRPRGMSAASQRLMNETKALSSEYALENAYRQALYDELDAEFARLGKENENEKVDQHRAIPSLVEEYQNTVSEIEIVEQRDNERGNEHAHTTTTTKNKRVLQSVAMPIAPTDVLLNFHPYIVITSGRAYFENPTFQGVYHMFFGDFPQIAKYSNTDNYITNTIKAVPSDSAIFGHITQEDLTLTAISATIEIFDSNDNQEYSIRQINLFNATLQLNRNVTVTGGSFVTGSLITSVGESTESLIPYVQGGESHPFVTFSNNVYTGVSLQSIFAAFGSALGQSSDGSGTNSTEQTVVTVNSCTMVIDGSLISDSPTENRGSLNIIDLPTRLSTNARYVLTEDAQIKISTTGTLALLTETYIEAATSTSPAVLNLGKVELLGRTKAANFSYGGKLNVNPFSEAARVGSLASRLVVFGDFIQTASGSTTVYLNRTQQTAPVLFLINSANYAGSVYVDFYTDVSDNVFPDIVLYDGPPSAWSVIAFRDKFSSSSLLAFNDLVVHPQSPGLVFSQDTMTLTSTHLSNTASISKKHATHRNKDDSIITADSVASTATTSLSSSSSDALVNFPFPNVTSLYAWGLEIEAIGCPQINEYYYGVPQQDLIQASAPNAYACYVCLRNSSCNLCNGVNGAAAGVCAVAGTCGSAGVAYGDSCCDGGCNGQYGTCQVNAEHTEFHCDCGKTIWYTGNNCKDLSASAYVVIFSCVSFILFLLIMGFFYRRSKKQKQEVLDELADGLLNLHNNTDGNNDFIQYMQQALILNDVFVKWEEITLESIVGEGSFGVVHKATFRGAQVAVKQMRSMFMELTDKEIDEFRKEAYVMSRLRHPNIVLVMGISLVDQEPIALPKSRSQNMSVDNPFDSNNPMGITSTDSGNNAKKPKPQKTVCIITEFLEQGSLADILYGPTKLPAEIWTYELVLTCALQAARGMLYLHSHSPPICHRDLKSSNLVVDDHWVVKVTDFGMSRIVPENVQDREKGVLSGSGQGANQASSYPLGPRKYSTAASPAGRKFMLGWGGGPSTSVNSPSVETRKQLSLLTPEEEAAKIEAEDAGERPSIDSMQDYLPPGGEVVSRNNQSSYVKNPNASRLSTFNPEMTSNLGTTAWCAPEVLVSGQKTRYTVKVDVYSFGLVLWELWEKKRPFEELTSRFDIMDAVRAGKRPEISGNCPPSFRSLIQRCWQHEPSRRPMFKYIVRYLKDELDRVKRQKGTNLINHGSNADSRASESADPERRSGSNFSGAGGVAGGIADAAEAAAEFFRKSFSFNTKSSFNTSHQQAASPASNHRPWMANANRDRDTMSDRESEGSFNNPALIALQAAARSRPSDGTRTSDGSALTAGGTNSTGTRQSDMGNNNGGNIRPSETIPVNIPQGRSPLVTAVTSERSLSYLTESPSPFSQLAAINTQHNRVAGMAAASANPAPVPVPPSRVSPHAANNRWRDRYVLQFSGWQSSNPDAGLPPSLTSPAGTAPVTPMGYSTSTGLPPSRSVPSTPLPGTAAATAAAAANAKQSGSGAQSSNNRNQQQESRSPTTPSADISIAPANTTQQQRLSSGNPPGTTAVTLSRTNSNASSAASSPKPPLDRNLPTEEIFVLDEEQNL